MSWCTVVETKAFVTRAKGRLSEAELDRLILQLAKDPTLGDVIPGTAGVRKLRLGFGGRGKRGGARVIYYFYNDTMPVFLLSVYAKNESDDLDPGIRAELPHVVDYIHKTYGAKR